MGNWLSVLLGRTLAKDYVRRNVIAKFKVIAAVERAIKKEGFKAVFLVRMVYLPMVVKNYGLATLDISFFTIATASFCTGLPFAFMWTYLGSSAHSLVEIASGTSPSIVPDGYGTLVTVGGVAFIGLCFYLLFSYINKAFSEMIEEEPTTEMTPLKRQNSDSPTLSPLGSPSKSGSVAEKDL